MLMEISETRLHNNQQGFAALVIAIVLVLVLSLTTTGFVEIQDNEQHSALDKQLSSQAFYAAESGINDAAKALNSGFDVRKTNCGPYASGTTSPAGVNYLTGASSDSINNANSTTDASYSCLLINPFPNTYEYSAVSTTTPIVTYITGVDPTNPDPSNAKLISQLVVSWGDPSGGVSFAPTSGSDSFSTESNWSYTGMLQIGLTPLTSGAIDRNDLINNTYTAFLYPNDSSNVSTQLSQYPSYSSADGTGQTQGVIINGNCNKNNQPLTCNAVITNLGQANYLLTLRSIYQPTRVTIDAYDYSGLQLSMANGQTLVDSTGEAQGVLRRIQVRIPTHNSYYPVPDSLETMGSICKELQLTPNTGSSACSP